MGILQDLRALPRHFSRALCKVGEEGADRENDGKTASVSGQAWDSDTVSKAEERGMAKIGCHVMWCPNGPQDYGTDR